MRRVAVIGSGGAGKSVFARELASRTGLPVIHLDREFWGPNWAPMAGDEWADRVRALAAAERWIMDGNYSGTMDIRFARADTVVFLDLPRLVCLTSVLVRWGKYRRETRPDMAPGNREQLDRKFLAWIWNYPNTRRPRILGLLGHLPASTAVVRLTSRRAMRLWLEGIVPAEALAA